MQYSLIIEANDKNTAGYGIKNIIVTPYEVKVESIIPLREVSEEKQLYSEKFQRASEQLSANQLTEHAITIFDQDGNRLNFAEQNGTTNIFAVRGKKLTKLFIYIGTDAIDTLKEKDQQKIEEKAVYRREFDLE